jgi:phosphatidylserine/phosphatidylglycerophosphate/cardiolipin synthase-like enzyme
MTRRLLFSLLILIFLLSGCDAAPETPPAPPATAAPLPGSESPVSGVIELPMLIGYGYRGSFYDVYFTDPLNPDARLTEGGPDAPLVKAIDEARLSVDVAVYSMSLNSVRNALIDAHQRGVKVRVVMESDNMDRAAPQALSAAGIKIVGDFSEGLMHNKFVIIDGSEVWMGSMNLTTSGTYADNNNLLRIRSTQIAENYTVEFNEMYEKGFFGPDTVADTPNPDVTIDGIEVENYFSPDDGVAKRLAQLLRGAKSSIYFMAYSFTVDDFGEILIDKQLDGLTVAGIMEEEQIKSNQGTEYDPFIEAGLQVYVDGNEGQMHHKVFIIDQEIVVTGSYNFSASAEQRNDENIIIIHDPRLAALYVAEFQRLLGQVSQTAEATP